MLTIISQSVFIIIICSKQTELNFRIRASEVEVMEITFTSFLRIIRKCQLLGYSDCRNDKGIYLSNPEKNFHNLSPACFTERSDSSHAFGHVQNLYPQLAVYHCKWLRNILRIKRMSKNYRSYIITTAKPTDRLNEINRLGGRIYSNGFAGIQNTESERFLAFW